MPKIEDGYEITDGCELRPLPSQYNATLLEYVKSRQKKMEAGSLPCLIILGIILVLGMVVISPAIVALVLGGI